MDSRTEFESNNFTLFFFTPSSHIDSDPVIFLTKLFNCKKMCFISVKNFLNSKFVKRTQIKGGVESRFFIMKQDFVDNPICADAL
jgi:hypothetical protein